MTLHQFVSLAIEVGTHVASCMALLARLAVFRSPKGSEPRARFRLAFSLYLVHMVLFGGAVALETIGASLGDQTRIGAALTGTLASIGLGSVVAFEGLVLRLYPHLPSIVPALVTTIVAFIGTMHTSSRLGFDLTGVVATSAVLTAVIGLALQDTLGNAIGGIALQLDSSIKVGDFIRLGEVTGRVSEIHWRYTAIETNDWETVIVPNRLLMSSQVVVLGRRRGQPVLVRKQVFFRVDLRTSPSDVISVIERALRAHPVPDVASEPPPNCVAVDFADSQIKYAVRYWVDPRAASPTDSLVRTRIFYALTRAQIALANPAQTLFVNSDDPVRHAEKREAEQKSRIAALRRIDLFATLKTEDLRALAERLEHVPFAKGETITREGTHGQHLYMVVSGSISVRVSGVEEQHEVARLEAGDFFGEMALLSGELRSATSLALTDVDCYRLDADAFRALHAQHGELAVHVARVLASRESELTAAKERLTATAHAALRAQSERAFLSKIRSFFELD